jgi:serine/threonine-protein kinase mTOR
MVKHLFYCFSLLFAKNILLGHALSEFVRTCALPYLEDDSPAVRRQAAETCCKLFVRDPICYQSSSHAIDVISEVLDKLLTVGIADPGNMLSHL